MGNEYRALLEKAQKNRNMVVVYRDKLEGAFYGGIPVAQSRELLVLAREQEFQLDGWVALRQKDVTLVEQYDDNDFCRRVLEGEGVYGQAKAPGGGCRDWRELLDGIRKAHRGWATVECEAPEEMLFFVGVITAVDENYLMMRRVDADGSWHPDETTVPLQDITAVSFGGRYLRIYEKYCKAASGRRNGADGK